MKQNKPRFSSFEDTAKQNKKDLEKAKKGKILPGKCCNCLENLDKYQGELEAKAQNAFARSKWGMFAYYKAQAVHIRRVHLMMRKGDALNVPGK